MAMVQDELGNWYDDGTGGGYDTSYGSAFGNANYGDQPEGGFDGSDGFHDFTGINQGGDGFHDFTGINQGGDSFHDFTGTTQGLPRSLGGNQNGGMPSVDDDFAPTYPITGGGIGGRTVVGGGSGILDYLKSMNLTNAGGLAGALAGATGAFTNKPKKAYEGSIPQMQAIRNMVLAPPTANYRPGQGGVNYNADTYYVPKGSVSAGESANMAAATAAANAANAAKVNPTADKKSSALSNIAKTAGLAALAKQILGSPGNKTTDGLKTLLDKVTGGTTGSTVLDKILGGGTKTTAGGTTAGGTTAGGTTAGGGKTTNTGGTTAGAAKSTGTAANTGTAGAVAKAVTAAGTPAGGVGSKSGVPAGGGGGGGGAGNTRGIGGGTDTGAEGEEGLTTPEGDYAGADEFTGIDEQIAANENDLETPNQLTDEEVDEELARVAAETNEEYGLGGNDTGFDFDGDGYFDYGGGDDYGFNLDDFGGDYSNFDFGGGDDFEFDLGDYDFARGGRVNMAKGRYLQGNTDGMADKIPAQIGRKQPAALSHGEFVVPADVVSHLGNGNSDAGAKKLYQMMDRIRVARTGNKEQGKQINPDKFMPGGLTNAYVNGGRVQGFPDGGTVGATGLGAAVNAGITGTETGPNSFAGDYISNMLGKSQALAESPYQQYMGPLTAGESPLQASAFNNAAGLQTPSSIGTAATTAGNIGTAAQGLKYTPTTTSFDATQAQNYMNPYLQASLNPQLDEARRQSQLTQQQNDARMTQGGAFGGGRNAIMNAETQRNLGTNLANITGTGYNTAFNNAQNQFNADQSRKMQENQYGAGYGLQGLQTGLQAAQAQGALGVQRSQADINNLNAQLTAGGQQRGIEAEGMAADKASFEAARENPYKMLQFQQSMLQGMPISATSYNIAQPTKLQEIMAGAAGGAKQVGQSNKTVADLLKDLGL